MIISAHVRRAAAICPACEQSSTRVHSFYVRSPQDLPLGEQAALPLQQS